MYYFVCWFHVHVKLFVAAIIIVSTSTEKYPKLGYWYELFDISRCHIFHNTHIGTCHSSPSRGRYGGSLRFKNRTSLLPVVQYYIGPRHNAIKCHLFHNRNIWVGHSHMLPGVGVTKAPFVNFSVSKIFGLAKVHVRFPESHPYLTGVTAAELRRHLPNMNAIFNS